MATKKGNGSGKKKPPSAATNLIGMVSIRGDEMGRQWLMGSNSGWWGWNDGSPCLSSARFVEIG